MTIRDRELIVKLFFMVAVILGHIASHDHESDSENVTRDRLDSSRYGQ